MVVRVQVAETPLFQDLQDRAESRRSPATEVFTRHGRVLSLGILAGIAGFATQGILSVWAVQHARQLRVPQPAILDIKAWAPLGMFIVMALAAWISDRVGRRAVMLTACAVGAVLSFPLLLALDTGTIWGTAVAIIVGQALVQGALFGPYTAFLSELFPTEVRYTGTSLAYQSASTLGAGFTPLLAAELMRRSGSVIPIAVVYLAAFVITATAVLVAREGRGREFSEIDSDARARLS
ncbi:hypothetical protein GCM10027030_14320 [Luteococcus sediminum]